MIAMLSILETATKETRKTVLLTELCLDVLKTKYFKILYQSAVSF